MIYHQVRAHSIMSNDLPRLYRTEIESNSKVVSRLLNNVRKMFAKGKSTNWTLNVFLIRASPPMASHADGSTCPIRHTEMCLLFFRSQILPENSSNSTNTSSARIPVTQPTILAHMSVCYGVSYGHLHSGQKPHQMCLYCTLLYYSHHTTTNSEKQLAPLYCGGTISVWNNRGVSLSSQNIFSRKERAYVKSGTRETTAGSQD